MMVKPPITIFQFKLPKGFSYIVSVSENGTVSSCYQVIVGTFDFEKGIRLKSSFSKRLEIYNFLNQEVKMK